MARAGDFTQLYTTTLQLYTRLAIKLTEYLRCLKHCTQFKFEHLQTYFIKQAIADWQINEYEFVPYFILTH